MHSELADRDNGHQQEDRSGGCASCRCRRLHSRQLLGNRRKIIIEHHGEEYILCITSKGKLILTK